MKNASQDTSWFGAPRPVFQQAIRVLNPLQKKAAAALFVVLLTAAVINGTALLFILNALMAIFYLASTIYRIFLIDLSMQQNREIRVSTAELREPEGSWPNYLILAPLYKEAAILPHLVKNLKKIDYPTDKMEARLLVEEDDEETRSAAEAMNLPDFIRVTLIPANEPRTKPKACNVGMQHSKAEFAVIYDAEDKPDPDQLKKAVIAFSRVPQEVGCIQAKLNFYNPEQNLLTRCFTAEYAMWFDMCLPGLDALQAPIPLGGTSNHFRMDVLKKLGGWDEYNVTEDCELGLRLFDEGYRTRILDSTTWEQACPSLGNWIRQRSRWLKGYMQTWLVHLRDPVRQTKSLGLIHSLHFHMLIGATAFFQIINPFYWILTFCWFFFHMDAVSAYFPGPIFAMAALCLFAGNFVFAYTCTIACVRRGFGQLAGFGLFMPLYWALMSVAAWKGALQLIFKPHYWEKTKHFAVEMDETSGGEV